MRVISFDGNSEAMQWQYHGQKIEEKIPLGQSKTTFLNSWGKPDRVIDALGNVTAYSYDSVGRLISTIDPHGNEITNRYNQVGQKIETDDPDLGKWKYRYNSLGRVTSMSDAKGTQTVTTYDLLNRPLTRIDSFGAQDASTTIWTYDNSEGGIGKISSVTDGGGYSRLYSYDDHGREETVDEVIDGQSYKTKTLYRGATQKVDGIVYPNEMLVRTDYNEYGFPVEVRSAGMVEYQQYLDQKSLIEDLGNEANLLFENLEPVRAEHVKKYNALVTRGAEPAIKAQDFASKGDAEMGAYQSWVTLTNRYAVQRSSAISLYNGLVHEHNAKQEEIVKLEARTCPFAGHVRRGEGRSAAFDKKEAQYQQCMKEKHGTIAHNRNRVSEINDKLPPIKSRINHLLVKRQESEAKADRYMMQARAYFDQANDYSTKARFYYDKAAIHLTSIESINRQIRSKISLVEGAIDKAASMLMMYEGGSVLQWDAGEVDAYGRVTRFTQGNGTVTKLDYDPKSRQISHILTQLDNGNSAYSSIDGVGTSLSQLSNLILNFGEIAERHKVKAQNARKSREEGLKALSLLEETRGVLMIQNKPLDASSLQPEIAKQQLEIDLQEGDMTLFEGLSAIHHNTAINAQLLHDAFKDSSSVRSGRKLETGYHSLLEAHYQSISELYLDMADRQFHEKKKYQEASLPTNLEGFAQLAERQSKVAYYNEVRHQTIKLKRENEGGSDNGLSAEIDRSWAFYSTANLYEKRSELYDLMASGLEKVHANSRSTNSRLSGVYLNNGKTGGVNFFKNRENLGAERIEQYQRLADISRSRASSVRQVAGQVTQDERLPQLLTSATDAFEYLADVNRNQASMFLSMSSLEYWQDFYGRLELALVDTRDTYMHSANANAELARTHREHARVADDFVKRMSLLGDNGEIQDTVFQYDLLGRLISRSDNAINMYENFDYDDLNRLISYKKRGEGKTLYGMDAASEIQYEYDEIGNIRYQSGVGYYNYGESGAGVHAVSSITGDKNIQYEYDANGNMILGGERQFQFGPHNKPTRIQKANVITEFYYGPERQLYKQVEKSNGVTTTNIWVGGIYQKTTIVDSGLSSEKHQYLVKADTGVTSIINQKSDMVPESRYLHRDSLDSVIAISDENGQITDRVHYSPFGQRRVAMIDESEESPPQPGGGEIIKRGFTGHSHLLSSGLIHMGGRVYDPGIGRFVSADPFIQSPTNGQSFNRYSYVLNNPLSLVDPSGYASFFKSIRRLLKDSVTIIDREVLRATKKILKDPDYYMDMHRKTFARGGVTGHLVYENNQVKIEETIQDINHKIHFVGHSTTVKDLVRDNKGIRVVGGIIASAYGGPWGAAGWASYLADINGASFNDIIKAGAISYVSASGSSAISGMFPGASDAFLAVANASFQGAVAEATGGDFEDTFLITIVAYGAKTYYERVTGGMSPHIQPGETRPEGEGYVYEPNPDGTIPETDRWKNISGINEEANGGFFHDSLIQGGPVSTAINYGVPGGHGISAIHDIWLNRIAPDISKSLVNVLSMIPAAIVHTVGLVGVYPEVIHVVD